MTNLEPTTFCALVLFYLRVRNGSPRISFEKNVNTNLSVVSVVPKRIGTNLYVTATYSGLRSLDGFHFFRAQ